MGEAVAAGALQGPRHRGAVRGAHEEPPGGAQQFRPGFLLQVLPQLVGPAQEGDVVRVLVVGQADDARFAVGRAPGVAGGEGVQAQDAPAPAGQMEGGGAAQPAQPDHDGVVLHLT